MANDIASLLTRRGKIGSRAEKNPTHIYFEHRFHHHGDIMKFTKKTRARRSSGQEVRVKETMKGCHLSFQMGMLGLEAGQPGKSGRKFHLFILKKDKKKTGQENQNFLNPA